MWFTLNCAAALLVFVIFHSLQQRRLQQQQQTLAAQVHCRSTLDSVSALMAYLSRREPFLLYKTNSDASSVICTVRYKEPMSTDLWKWGGEPPEVQLTFDKKAVSCWASVCGLTGNAAQIRTNRTRGGAGCTEKRGREDP